MVPHEGMSDYYRDPCHHGKVLSIDFTYMLLVEPACHQ